MTDVPPGRTHPAGETTETPERPAHCLVGPVLSFDLTAEIDQLHREEAWRRGEHPTRR